MRFVYPHKLHLLGMIVFIAFTVYGFIEIFTLVGWNLLLILFYVLFCGIIIFWYYNNYMYYKTKQVDINENELIVKNGNAIYNLRKCDIESIVEVRHMYIFKLYSAIHIYTKEDKVLNITSDIKSFEKLKEKLKIEFKDLYIEKKEVVRGKEIIDHTT